VKEGGDDWAEKKIMRRFGAERGGDLTKELVDGH
jgi:hypothetical protein